MRFWYRFVIGGLALLSAVGAAIVGVDPGIWEMIRHRELMRPGTPAEAVSLYVAPALVLSSMLWALLAAWCWIRRRKARGTGPEPGFVAADRAACANMPAAGNTARVCLSVMLAGGCLAAALPLLQRELGNDEQINLALNVQGYWQVRTGEHPERFIAIVEGTEGGLKRSLESSCTWMPARWQDTFFLNKQGNNSAPYSVLARLCVQAGDGVFGAGAGARKVWIMRIPALAFGIAAVVLWFNFVARIGGLWRGLIAAFLMGSHPSQLEFAARARCYSMVIFLTVLSLCLLARAAKRGGLWWLAFQACLGLLFYTFSGAVYAVVALELAAFGFIVHHARNGAGHPTRWAHGRHWLASMIACMAVFSPLALPGLVQTHLYVNHDYPRHLVPEDHFWRLWNIYAIGALYPTEKNTTHPAFKALMAPRHRRPLPHLGPDKVPQTIRGRVVPDIYVRDEWCIYWLSILVVPAMMLAGVCLSWRASPLLAASFLALLAAAVLAVLHQKLLLNICGFHWYYLYALPSVSYFLAAALAPEIRGRWRVLVPSVATAFVASLALISFPDSRLWRFDYYGSTPGPTITRHEWTFGDHWATFPSGETVHLVP